MKKKPENKTIKDNNSTTIPTEKLSVEQLNRALSEKNKELEVYKKEMEKLVSKRTHDLEVTLKQLRQSNQEIRRKNESLNILLQEVHHRVANNLQIILSLIRIKYLSSEKALAPEQFKDLENRILSMALVHQNIMTKGYISKNDFSSYISDLVRHIQRSNNYDESINIVKNIGAFSVQPNSIFYLGLILTEIFSNSIRHAFEHTEIPTISVKIRKDEYHNIIEISDNGSGFDLELWENPAPASGFDVIKVLAEQIDGEIICTCSNGTKLELTLPFS